MKYGAPGTPEALEAERTQLIRAKVDERRRWAELARTYARCLDIVEQVWTERLNGAQLTQQVLAEEMRDRHAENPQAREWSRESSIPVPLFTPRDRQQFLKEATATLLISADRRNLTVTPEVKREAHEAPEAASAADETEPDAEAQGLDAAGTRPDAEAPAGVARA